MNRVLATLLTLAALGAAAGGAVVLGGLYNVSAREGHWPGVGWVLHTTYRNSVELRAPPPSAVPDLTDAMAGLGARHFDAACRPCHAAPGQGRTATMAAMEPVPPHIGEAVMPWQAHHLHWIVREGVKMSGMPAWPADRDDEVWPVVAFLTRVPDLDAGGYRDLTAPGPAPADAPPGTAYCTGCHGEGGASRNPHVPRLDILSEGYMATALRAYLDGKRESGVMAQAATEVRAEDLGALAAWFAAQPPAPGARPVDPDLSARGEALATAATGDPEIPACVACHGPGRAPDAPGGPGPALAGQHEPYLATQLRLWRDGNRGGGPRSELMRHAARHLSDGDIAALSAWYAGLPPDPEGR